ncbi:selenium metabolism-associated LysR family transcriptional regulator [Mesobacillus maritimus]|uniref:LysR family transcriptional regulator n=1 Tax=Mesobacillus maritimus TaxID=1643336 RepID=A0ABS7K0K9_9BACI|nr:selenium metabolism-associated LysR family transcriptional regulator [Mesobacillus maritimus]MBY0095788.1 LysR family transcriptional regulator [Mesobacillus maritimus]
MNLKKIEAFLLIVEKNSFSIAAESLGLTQPAVSNQVKSLEHDLGVKLIERGSSSIQLTPAGNFVYQQGKQLLEMANDMQEGVKSFQGVLTGSLRIGASTIPGTYLLPKWIGQFYHLFPKVEVINEIADSKQNLEWLMDRHIHIAVTGDKSDSPEMISELVATDSLVLIAPKGHPLTLSPLNQNQGSLVQYPFVLREIGSGTRKSMEAGLNLLGIQVKDLQVVAQLGSTEAIIAAVEAGLGISFVSSFAARPAMEAGRVQQIPIEPTFQQRYYLSYLKGKQENPLIGRFIELVGRECVEKK